MSVLKISRWTTVAFATCLIACDLGSKSVSGTADEAGDDGNDDAGTTTGANPTGGPDLPGTDGDGDGATSQGPGDDDGGIPPEPECLEMVTEITDTSQLLPLGFSADDIIALSNGWSVDFVWTTDNGGIDVVPEGTTTTLDIGLTYVGGAINFIESEINPDNPNDIFPDCSDRLEIDLQIDFSTVDGRFAETFEATGIATSADQVSISRYFGPDEFEGSFSADEVSFPEGNGMVNQFAIFADFSATEDPRGSLNIEIQQWFGDDPDEGFVGFGVIAGFPEFGE